MPAQTAVTVKSIRLEFGLELHRELRIAAAKEDVSMAALVRRVVEQYLKGELVPKKKGAGR